MVVMTIMRHTCLFKVVAVSRSTSPRKSFMWWWLDLWDWLQWCLVNSSGSGKKNPALFHLFLDTQKSGMIDGHHDIYIYIYNIVCICVCIYIYIYVDTPKIIWAYELNYSLSCTAFADWYASSDSVLDVHWNRACSTSQWNCLFVRRWFDFFMQRP